ncbi:hypothetical protein Ddc_20512 [Ditylenchus destructor]|nr:hypothetical protein Ddc_20512 [Ditylenchus destructor]
MPRPGMKNWASPFGRGPVLLFSARDAANSGRKPGAGRSVTFIIIHKRKVESKNERRCEVVVENCDPNYCKVEALKVDLISERAKSMIERPGDVVVEFPKGDPGRIYKYPRRIFDK